MGLKKRPYPLTGREKERSAKWRMMAYGFGEFFPYRGKADSSADDPLSGPYPRIRFLYLRPCFRASRAA